MSTQRITQKDLQNLVDRVNEEKGTPKETYTDGKANVGNYTLYYAYGGVAVHQITNQGGGVRDLCGIGTKRETYQFLRGMLS